MIPAEIHLKKLSPIWLTDTYEQTQQTRYLRISCNMRYHGCILDSSLRNQNVRQKVDTSPLITTEKNQDVPFGRESHVKEFSTETITITGPYYGNSISTLRKAIKEKVFLHHAPSHATAITKAAVF